MRILLSTLIVAALLVPALVFASSAKTSPTARATHSAERKQLSDLAWLAGHWRQGEEDDQRMVEELWMPPRGGIMLGLNRTVFGGVKTVAWEYLRIEQRGDDVVYLASPSGRAPATPFELTEVSATHAVFENPAHDFPKRIEYRVRDDGRLVAAIAGDEPGPSWTYEAVGEVE